jgi:hypothetical protein
MTGITMELDHSRPPTSGEDKSNVVQLAEPRPDPWPWPAPIAPLKLEPWQYPGPYDPARSGLEPLPLRREDGKALRESVLYQMHGLWAPAPNRPDPVAVLMKTNEGRQQDFVRIRMGRMAASPFGFLRGACAVMAWDLAHTQVTGATVVMAGDAHLNNFGFYGTPQRDVGWPQSRPYQRPMATSTKRPWLGSENP